MMAKMFIGGVSTKPEVDRLMSSIEAEPGTQVPYDTVEELTGTSREEHRFRTIMTAWRKRLYREKYIEVSLFDGAVNFLTPDAAFEKHRGEFHRVGRKTGRIVGRTRAINTESLSSDEKRQQHRLFSRVALEVREQFSKGAKELAGPKPVSNVAPLRIQKTG